MTAPRVVPSAWMSASRDRVEARLAHFLGEKRAETERRSPASLELVEAIDGLTMRGGKRLRPMVLEAAYRAVAPTGDPPAATARETARPDFISLTLAKDGRLALDEAELGGLDEVAPRLRERLAARRDKDRLVVVRADASLPHVAVRRLLEAAREGGARNLGIATSQITDGRP